MNLDLSDWDNDLPSQPEEVYQDLLLALKRKSGFGLFFVQCTSPKADYLITQLPKDITEKKIEVLSLIEPIDNLYRRVATWSEGKHVEILLIKGLEYSFYKYEKRNFGEITEGQFSNLTSVPPVLNHLNQQRERFRDDFPICFVFLLKSFSISYLIHRAPDFFDWRSGIFELETEPEVIKEETERILLEGNYDKYLKFSSEEKIEKILEIQDLLAEKHQTSEQKSDLLLELGFILASAKEFEGSVASFDQAIKFQPDLHQAWYNRGIALRELKRYEDAIESYDQAIKFQPDKHEAWYNRGNALDQLKRYEDAIESYDQAIKFQPDKHEAWYNRGIALDELKRYEDAIESYDQAIKFQPDYHQAWYNRGIALTELKRYEDAIESYDQAIKF